MRGPCADEQLAIQHLSVHCAPTGTSWPSPIQKLRQVECLEPVYQKTTQALLDQAACSGRARLRAVAAKGVDAWLHQNPGMTQDTLLPDPAFRDAIGLRLGLAIFDGFGNCSCCQQPMDPQGHHVLACMGQGYKQLMHTTLRDSVFRVARAAGVTPQLEPLNLLPDDPQVRPADILVRATPQTSSFLCAG